MKALPMMIYLLRHGQIEGPEKRRFIGQIDVSLNERGKKQAEYWKKRLSNIPFDRIYSSDLSRTSETAAIIADGQPVIYMKELREINLGSWEGLFIDDVKKRFLKEWEMRGKEMATFQAPEGESFNQLSRRAVMAFENIVKDRVNNVLMVTHAGVIRTILCHVLNMPINQLFSLGQDYGGMNMIDCRRNPMQVVALNITPWKKLDKITT